MNNNLLHNIIKISYSKMGYLPDYPYHLISDREMFNAFLHRDEESGELSGYFIDTYYPSLSEDTILGREPDDISTPPSEWEKKTVADVMDRLETIILNHISDYIENDSEVPTWVYSYMTGAVIHPNSPEDDFLNLTHDLGIETKGKSKELILKELQTWAYRLSWIYEKTIPVADWISERPSTIFFEPIILRQIRLGNI